MRAQRPLLGVAAILSGTAIGQLVTLFALPILSRLFTPEQFGVATFASSLVAIFIPFALLRLNSALVLPQHDVDVAPLLWVSGVTLTLGSLVVGVVLFVGGVGVAPQELRPFLSIAIPALLLLTGIVALLSELAIRERHYTRVATRNTIQSLGITGFQLALSVFRKQGSINALVIGLIAGATLGAALLAPYGRKYHRRVSLLECAAALRRYWRFPLIFAPTATMTIVAYQGPVLFTAFWFGSAQVGQLGMAERLVAVPLALIGLAVGQVFGGELSERVRTGKGGKLHLYMRTSGGLAVLGVAVAAGILLFGPPAVSAFLGPEWSGSADIARSMSLIVVTRMVAGPTRPYLQLLELGRGTFILEMTRFALLLVSVILVTSASLELSVALWVLYSSLALADILTWLYGWKVLKREDARL